MLQPLAGITDSALPPAVTVRDLKRVPSGRVQRLVGVADEMQDPNEIVRAHVLRGARGCGQGSDHQLELRDEVDRILGG
jgi:hypothetical protein